MRATLPVRLIARAPTRVLGSVLSVSFESTRPADDRHPKSIRTTRSAARDPVERCAEAEAGAAVAVVLSEQTAMPATAKHDEATLNDVAATVTDPLIEDAQWRLTRGVRRKSHAEGAQRLVEPEALDDLFAKIATGDVQLKPDKRAPLTRLRRRKMGTPDPSDPGFPFG